MSLIRKVLGRTGFSVTNICWGCGPVGVPENYGRNLSEHKAVATIKAMFASPVNFLDTARAYGESEVRIGKALQQIGGVPAGCLIATKADREPGTNSFSAAQIRKSVRQSCERLGLPYLPLVYLHDPEYHPLYETDKQKAFDNIMKEAVEALEDLHSEGIIGHLGISGGPIDMLTEFVRTGRFEVVITHNRWNLLWQVAEPLITEANRMGVAIVNAAPYATGILISDKPSARAVYQVPSRDIQDRAWRISEVCRRYNVSMGAVALQFSLRDSRINSTIVGVSSPQEVAQTVRFAQETVPDEVWEQVRPFAITHGDPEDSRREAERNRRW